MNYTHCDHGKPYGDDCDECDLVWIRHVTLPNIINGCERVLMHHVAIALSPEIRSCMSALIAEGKRAALGEDS